MHKIQEKEFTLEDFSCEHLLQVALDDLEGTIETLNDYRVMYLETKDKKYWWQMIQLLPSSYNQTRNVMMNSEVLCNIYKSRKDHKLDCWREFCKWIEELPYHELICGKDFNIPDEAHELVDSKVLYEQAIQATSNKED